MNNIKLNPRKKVENETERQYKEYLRNFYFENNKPCPQTRYEFACSENLTDSAEVMDGKDGAYTKYLESFYADYYSALENLVNLAFHMSEAGIPKNSITTKFSNAKNKMKSGKIKVKNNDGKLVKNIIEKLKPKKKVKKQSKFKSIINKLSNLKISEEVKEKLMEKAAKVLYIFTLAVTIFSIGTFLFTNSAMGLVVGMIGMLALKPLTPEKKANVAKKERQPKVKNKKTKLSFNSVKEKLVKVFTKKKTDSESGVIVDDEMEFDTKVDESEILPEEQEIEFDTKIEEIEQEPEIEFDTKGVDGEIITNPEVVSDEQEISFDTSVSEYNLNEGQAGVLEQNSLSIPSTNTKLSIYTPEFYRQKITKLFNKENNNEHVKVMKK